MSTPEVIELEFPSAIEVIEIETPGLSTQAAIDAADRAEAAADGVETFADAAEASATAASASASAASTSASNAATSASGASTSASSASTSASNASTSASNASTSATNAANSASAAATSETNAAASASTASTKASEATTSAGNASTFASQASDSADSAQSSAGLAASSETNAATSETNAANSASAASTSASNASTSASNAATSETNASNSASAASTSATNASNSASAASTSATNAGNSATAADASADAAAASAAEAAGYAASIDPSSFLTDVTEGTGISIDKTDPQNPVISATGGSGSGDVVGPASAVNNNFAAFDTTTGKLIKDSGSSASSFATAAQGTAADAAVVGAGTVTSGNPVVFSGTTGKAISQVTFATFKTSLSLVKGDVGLGNVDNTSDANKPVSTAQQTALDLKAPIANPTFTGVATFPNTGLHIFDTNSSHDLIIAPGSNITADRTLTITTGDQNRTINISAADFTLGAFGATLVDDTTQAAAQSTLGVVGTQAIWVPAGAMIPRTTNGAASGTAETTTNRVMISTLDFDATTQEFAQFSIRMPKSWNESTVTFSAVWSHASTTTNFGVVWQLQGLALGDSDAMDTAFGTAQTSTDTGGTTNDIWTSPTSSAITIAGTPAQEDLVIFQVARVPANGSDTMAIDARLHGVTVYITTDAGNDA